DIHVLALGNSYRESAYFCKKQPGNAHRGAMNERKTFRIFFEKFRTVCDERLRVRLLFVMMGAVSDQRMGAAVDSAPRIGFDQGIELFEMIGGPHVVGIQ